MPGESLTPKPRGGRAHATLSELILSKKKPRQIGLASTIVRFCAGISKVGYLLRTIPASDALEPFSQFDLAVLTARS
jgi:hypothetical protein